MSKHFVCVIFVLFGRFAVALGSAVLKLRELLYISLVMNSRRVVSAEVKNDPPILSGAILAIAIRLFAGWLSGSFCIYASMGMTLFTVLHIFAMKLYTFVRFWNSGWF